MIKKVTTYFAIEISAKILPIILTPFYIKVFSLESYGILALYSTITSSIIPFIGLSANTLLVADYSKKSDLKKRFSVIFYLSLLMTCILYSSIAIGDFFKPNNLIGEITSYAIVTAILNFYILIFKDCFLINKNQNVTAFINFSQLVLVNIFTFYFAQLFEYKKDLWYFRFYAEFITLPAVLVASIICAHYVKLLSVKKIELPRLPRLSYFFETVRHSIHFIPFTFFHWYRLFIDRQYILIIINAGALGLYSLATQIAAIPMMVISLVINFYNYKIIEIAKKKGAKETTNYLVGIAIIVQLFCLTIFYLFGELILKLYLKNIYSETLLNISIIQTFGVIFLIFGSSIRSIPIYLSGKRKQPKYIWFFYIIHPAIIYLIPDKSLVATSMASSISLFLYFIFSVKYCYGKE